jgi:hypothetical protein
LLDEPTLIPELATASAMTCEAPATKIGFGEAVNSEIVASTQSPERKYFCVQVPPGVTSLTFELTGTMADLNLYVGFPDLETVQHGGVWLWHTEARGAVDKTIVIEPAPRDYVHVGPYYLEVSAEDFQASSPFTLRVRIPEQE